MRGRILTGIVLCARVAQGDDGSASSDIEDVVVRGTAAQGFAARAKLDDATREITDAASLVEPLVGVHVRRLGADDGFATLSVRGSSSNQIAFYLAGVPLPAAADPTVDLATLPLWPGSQARVFRTFAPATLGPGSLGGTLAIDGPSASGPSRTDVWTAGGSFGSMRMRLGDVSDVGRGVRVASGLSVSRSSGDFSYYDVLHNPPTNDPREFVPRLDADVAQASGLVAIVMPVHFGASRSGTLRTTVLLQDREQGLPGTIFLPTISQRLRTDRELATTELSLPASGGVFGAQLFGVRQGSDFKDHQASLGPSTQTTTVISLGGNVSYRRRFGNVQFASKLDGRGERYSPGEYAGPSPPTGATRSAFGGGVDVEWRPTKAVTAAASGRVDGWYDGSDDPSIASSFTARPAAHVGIEGAAGPWTAAVHGGYTARPANFVERFGAPGGFIPTPDLRPESALTVDGGVRFRKRFGKLRIEGEVDAFAQSATDLITFVLVSARGLPKATNIGQATLAGVEAELLARLFGAELRVSYTGLHTENGSLCTPDCKPLPGRPDHDLVVDLGYELGPFRARYGLDGLWGAYADASGTIGVPARVLQSVGLRYDVTPAMRVSVDVRNLADVRTANYAQGFLGTTLPYPIGDVYQYPLPGRSFLISLAWHPRQL